MSTGRALVIAVSLLIAGCDAGAPVIVPSAPPGAASAPSATDGPGTSRSPGQPAASPGQAAVSPETAAASPEGAPPSPGQPAAVPGQPAASPEGAPPWPAQPATSPGQPATSPGQPAASPGQPAASPAESDWTALDWPLPLPLPPDALVSDVVAWQSEAIVVGAVQASDGLQRAAAWATTDWWTWTATLLERVPGGDAIVDRVVAVDGDLLAVGRAGRQRCLGLGEGDRCDPLSVAMWTSADGRTWTRQPVPDAFDGVELVGVVSTGSEVVVAGRYGWNGAATWRTTDGTAWRADAAPDSFADAHPIGLARTADGRLVMTGHRGGHEPECCLIRRGDWTPTAWWWDGSAWQDAEVPAAARSLGQEIGQPFAGRDGLIAGGTRNGHRAWTSADGTTWTRLTLDRRTPWSPWTADGTRIVGRRYAIGGGAGFLVSTDGTTWSPLAPRGRTDKAPWWGSDHVAIADEAHVVGDRLVVLGEDRNGAQVAWLVAPIR